MARSGAQVISLIIYVPQPLILVLIGISYLLSARLSPWDRQMPPEATSLVTPIKKKKASALITVIDIKIQGLPLLSAGCAESDGGVGLLRLRLKGGWVQGGRTADFRPLSLQRRLLDERRIFLSAALPGTLTHGHQAYFQPEICIVITAPY